MKYLSERNHFFKAVCSALTAVSILLSPILALAQTLRDLPPAGAMVLPGGAYTPALVTGMTIDPKRPLRLSFRLDK